MLIQLRNPRYSLGIVGVEWAQEFSIFQRLSVFLSFTLKDFCWLAGIAQPASTRVDTRRNTPFGTQLRDAPRRGNQSKGSREMPFFHLLQQETLFAECAFDSFDAFPRKYDYFESPPGFPNFIRGDVFDPLKRVSAPLGKKMGK